MVTSVLVGIDPAIGNDDNYILSHFLLDYLAELGFITLSHINCPPWLYYSGSYWMTVEGLGLGNVWVDEWNDYILYLNKSSIRLNINEDELVWSMNMAIGKVYAKSAYATIASHYSFDDPKWWVGILWK